MEIAGGDERTRIVLQRKLPGRNCLHCSREGHDHTICPERPCYTCGAVGHLALSCPHRRRPNLGLRLDHHRDTYIALRSHLRDLELGLCGGLPPQVPSPQLSAKVQTVFDRAHARRVTALEWHPKGRLVISGDKRGVIAVTDVGVQAARGEFDLSLASARPHYANVTALAFEDDETFWSGGMDGTVYRSHIEVALHGGGGPPAAQPPYGVQRMLNLNPDGWTDGMTMSKWRSVMAIAMDVNSRHCVYAATCKGAMHVLDARAAKVVAEWEKMHENKVQFLHVNPLRPELILSSGNDRLMALWDARKLGSGQEIGFYRHPKIVFGASFSPNCGSRIVSTCHDNRVRVWGDVNALVGNGNERCDAQPKEIVHSHNFNRYLSPFRAHWDPKDWTDDLFLVGRFLGDAYSVKRGYEVVEKILHPIDMFSARTGEVVGSIIDMAVTTKCPLNKFSPTHDMIVSGTSLHLAFWAVKNKNMKEKKVADGDSRSAVRRRPDDSDGEDEDDSVPKKKRKTVVAKKKNATSTVTHGRNTRSRAAAANTL